MCGIAGYVDFSAGRPIEAILRAMTEALSRRGPDGHGILMEGPCGLAHTRLSIIDVAGSPQPMRVSHSAISLVYNGELYNYRELRDELQAEGVNFDTAGDTEVILRWVEHRWSEALAKFDGMFGFAAWDMRRQSMLLGRDPMGVKPLFYSTPAPGMLVFGSEIKALLRHPLISRDLDFDAMRQSLRFRAVYGDRTLYKGIRQLDPGCYLEFDRSGLRAGRYFDLPEKTTAAKSSVTTKLSAELIDQGWDLFTRAVKKRLVADVPVGAFLSGGLDSSLVTAVMRQLRAPDEEVCTFSVGFEDDANSELPFAEQVATSLKTKHREVRVGANEYATRILELTGCRDAPLSEPADVAIAALSRVARETVKVVLSGEGADEVFAGYPKYGMAQIPWGVRKAVGLIGAERTSRLAGMMGQDKRRALVAARALTCPTELDRAIQWFSYLDRAELEAALPGLNWSEDNWALTAETQRTIFGRLNDLTKLGRMQTIDCLSWLPGNLLERADRMTMAEGLELRVPFLDKALVPFGIALPDSLKIRGRTSKWMVRQWASKHLPASIVGRRKWGFRVPLAEWFRGKLKGLATDYLLSGRGLGASYGNPARIRAMLESHLSGRIDANLAIWTLLVAEIWYQDVFQGSIASSRSAVA